MSDFEAMLRAAYLRVMAKVCERLDVKPRGITFYRRSVSQRERRRREKAAATSAGLTGPNIHQQGKKECA